MRRTLVAALSLTCAVAITATGTPAASATTVSPESANQRISSVLPSRTTSPILGDAFTMTVWDAASKSYVFKRRGKKSLRGASTTKILTAVGVLANLGPEHRFATKVTTGSTRNEIVLVAGGDPLLTSADLRTLARRTARALEQRSAPEPPGPLTVRADASLFQGGTIAQGWSSYWVPSEVRPVSAFARDDRKVTDATSDAAKYFVYRLRRAGITAGYAGPATAPDNARTVARFGGHTVSQAVHRMLLDSDNDTAEMLFRQVAVGRGIRPTWTGARRALRDTLAELRVPLRLVTIIDGSGLSLDGRVSAPALTVALRRALSPRYPDLAGIRAALPVAGRTGTLRAAYLRFTEWPSSCAAGLVQAKTGTLADAISLAGYATGADGATKVFVAIVNNRPTRYSRLTTRQEVDRPVSSLTGCW